MSATSVRLARARLCAGLMLAFVATSATTVASAADRWVVDSVTRSHGLTLRADRLPVAPKGRQLTMTVDGVGMPIVPGHYEGSVVLTPTDDITVTYKKLPPHQYRAAVYIDDGRYVASKSVAAAAQGGQVTDQVARDVHITSHEPRFNGIVVTGKSTYTIDSPVIDLVGNGGNDFAGFGAAIMSSGQAQVTVNKPRIRTQGAIRTAVFVGGRSTMHVNDADIEVYNGTLPKDYAFTIEVGRMMEVPWMLGLHGNVRATNLVDHGTVYYNRAHIKAQGWGALSTDDAAVTRMYVTDSLIEVTDSGYGAYSIGDSIDTFRHSTLNVADIGIILAGPGSAVLTDASVINSGRYGVMMHSGKGGSRLTVDKDSVINSRSTGIEIKGRGGSVLLDHAQVNAGNGVIVQAMENDDPFMKKMMAGPIVGVQPDDNPMAKDPDASPDVDVTVRDMRLTGDMVNTRTAQGELEVALESSTLVGAITTGTQAPIGGKEPTQQSYWQIGQVVNTYGPSRDAHGVGVKLDGGSRWTVTRTSYLNRLQIADGAQVQAAPGHRLALTVDGKPQPLRAGRYAGALVLEVSALH